MTYLAVDVNGYKIEPGAKLGGAILDGADLFCVDLSGADLRGAKLSRSDLFKANLSGADLSHANLSDAFLNGANLSNAKLTGANLENAKLVGANLTGTNLYEANLWCAVLDGAVMPNGKVEEVVQAVSDVEKKSLIERVKKFRWYLLRRRIKEGWFSWLMVGLLGGSMLVGGLREWAGFEIAWWPFGGGGSGECYFNGPVEICQ